MEKSIFNAIANFIKRGKKNFGIRYNYIFYEIIDFDSTNQTCTVKCINTLSYFFATVLQIAFDEDILYSLSPIHACFIGIECAQLIKHGQSTSNIGDLANRKDLLCRYGKYEILHKDRKGNICFIEKNTDNKPLSMDPRNIILSSDLVQEFDASQAFYIGLEAGFKLGNSPHETINNKPSKKPHLTLVK